MRLTKKAIEKIRYNTPAKNKLALALDCSVYTIVRWINVNDPNGDLTKEMALNIIQRETNLSREQILEDEPLLAA